MSPTAPAGRASRKEGQGRRRLRQRDVHWSRSERQHEPGGTDILHEGANVGHDVGDQQVLEDVKPQRLETETWMVGVAVSIPMSADAEGRSAFGTVASSHSPLATPAASSLPTLLRQIARDVGVSIDELLAGPDRG